jgi:iron complex transport system ATP-binding protein
MTGPSAPPALRLAGARVVYGTRVALHDVDLTVPEGEFLALTGPNGSGKSTLLRAALGLTDLAAGTVELFGDPLGSMTVRERARRVAWVPQDERLRDDVPLLRYTLYGRYAVQGPFGRETEADRTAARATLREVGLADREGDGLLTLSGGERQRAVLARAVSQGAPLLLLDEPTTHLDVGHQLDLLGRVRALVRDRRLTVVAALHDLNLAARFADRIVVLALGRRAADGPPAEVLSSELLASVWGIDADLRTDPTSGLPYLIPRRLVSHRPVPPRAGLSGPVHVVGGGGSAAGLLRELAEAGFELSAGVLHLLDTDAEAADALRLPTAIEAPFAPVGAGARARQRELLGRARAIVVAPFAVGPSNLANLDDLRPFVARVPTFLVDRPPITERDFCGGRAEAAYAALVRAGAVEVRGGAAVVPALRRALDARPPAAGSPGAGEPALPAER